MYIPVSEWDMCLSPPFLSSRRHSASACGIPRVMAVDGGLKGTAERVMLMRSRVVSSVYECCWKRAPSTALLFRQTLIIGLQTNMCRTDNLRFWRLLMVDYSKPWLYIAMHASTCAIQIALKMLLLHVQHKYLDMKLKHALCGSKISTHFQCTLSFILLVYCTSTGEQIAQNINYCNIKVSKLL